MLLYELFFALAPVFGEKSQYEALTPKEKKPPAAKESGDSSTKPKSSIPRPTKKDNSKKQAPKLKLEAAVAAVC